jgi:hypothetical protein
MNALVEGACTSTPTSALVSASPSTLNSQTSFTGTPAPTADTASSSPSALPTSVPPPTATPSTACPASVSSVSGKYSFQCPTGWHYMNCEGTSAYPPHTMLVNPDPVCNEEEYGVRAFAISYQGLSDPPRYLGTLQTSRNITVDGVAGTRSVYLVTVDNPLPPPKGTVQVMYKFVSGARTYYLEYDHFPDSIDRTSAFDQMVTSSLRFSS